MAMPSWIPEAWAELNEERQCQAENFLQSLLEQQREEDMPRKPFPFGILKDCIEVYDSFDDPYSG